MAHSHFYLQQGNLTTNYVWAYRRLPQNQSNIFLSLPVWMLHIFWLQNTMPNMSSQDMKTLATLLAIMISISTNQKGSSDFLQSANQLDPFCNKGYWSEHVAINTIKQKHSVRHDRIHLVCQPASPHTGLLALKASRCHELNSIKHVVQHKRAGSMNRLLQAILFHSCVQIGVRRKHTQ